MRFQESSDQLAAFFLRSVQLLAMAHRKTRENHQVNQRCQANLAKNRDDRVRSVVRKLFLRYRFIYNSSYRQQGEHDHHPCEAFHIAFVTPNLSNGFQRFGAFIIVVIRNDVVPKRGFSLVRVHNHSRTLEVRVVRYAVCPALVFTPSG